MNFNAIRQMVAATIVALLVLFSPITTTNSLALEAAQKAEIEQIIRNYILENPEIILEAQQSLEKKQALEAKKRIKMVLKQQAELIYASKHQFEIGNPKADVTVVEFFDYNCPYCKRAMADMDRLLEEDKGLKFVMKELPILSENSVLAHRISVAVGRTTPERYAEFHRLLLGGNGQKDGIRAIAIAGKMNLDVEKIIEIAKLEDVDDGFREVNDLANSLGMNGTPSYVIGDEVIFGALGYDVLKEKITNVRKCGNTICVVN